MSSIPIKACYRYDIRRIRPIQSPLQLTELTQLIAAAYELTVEGLKLKYTDDEGDRVTITSQQDLEEALEEQKQSLKIYVEVEQPTPSTTAASVQSASAAATQTAPPSQEQSQATVPDSGSKAAAAEQKHDSSINSSSTSDSTYIQLIQKLLNDRELLDQLANGVGAAIDSLKSGDATSTVIEVFIASVPRLTSYPLLVQQLTRLTVSPLSRCADGLLTPLRTVLQAMPNVDTIKMVITQNLLPQLILYAQRVEPHRLYEIIRQKLSEWTAAAHSGRNPIAALFKHPLFQVLARISGMQKQQQQQSPQSTSATSASSTADAASPVSGVESLLSLLSLCGRSAQQQQQQSGRSPCRHESRSAALNPLEALIRAATEAHFGAASTTTTTTQTSASASASSAATTASTEEGRHEGVTCDVCNKSNFTGLRFRCTRCFNFDLCQDCDAKKQHPADHPLIKIKAPIKSQVEVTREQSSSTQSQQTTSHAIHRAVECDSCGVLPIEGIRYKCSVCANYDMCSKCEAKDQHDPTHPLIKITAPILFGLRGDLPAHGVSRVFPFIHGMLASDETELRSRAASVSSASQTEPPKAIFISHANLPNGSVVPQNSIQLKQWNVRNTGKNKWPEGAKLIFVGGDELGTQVEFEVKAADQNETVPVTAVLTMPSKDGEYTSYFALADKDRNPFGERFLTTLRVADESQGNNPTRGASLAAQTSATSSHPQSFVLVEDGDAEEDTEVVDDEKSSAAESHHSAAHSLPVEEPKAEFSGVYAQQLSALRQLGFDNVRLNNHLLTLFGGDVTRVAAWLLENSK